MIAHSRKNKLILIVSMLVFSYQVSAADQEVLTPQEIAEIEHFASDAYMQELGRELIPVFQEVEAIKREVLDPVNLHKITHPREVWLEKVEDFNNQTLYTFNNITVPDLTINEHDFNRNGLQLRQFPLSLKVKDLTKPLFYLSDLLLDIHSMNSYVDELIEGIVEGIIRKKDLIKTNLDKLAMFDESDESIDEDENIMQQAVEENIRSQLLKIIQKSINQNDWFNRLAKSYFTKRLPSIVLSYIQKIANNNSFIFNRTPQPQVNQEAADQAQAVNAEEDFFGNEDDENVPLFGGIQENNDNVRQRDIDNNMRDAENHARDVQRDFERLNPMNLILRNPSPSITDNLITNNPFSFLIGNPLLEWLCKRPFERFFNEKITSKSYDAKHPALPRRGLLDILFDLVSFLGWEVEYYGLLEAAKESGWTPTFDESMVFTLCSEALFNGWFFYKTLNKVVTKQLKEFCKNDALDVYQVINDFEKKLTEGKNADQEKQKTLRVAFKEEVTTIVKNRFSSLQPILMQRLRDDRRCFNNVGKAALLVGSVSYKIMPIIVSLLNPAKKVPVLSATQPLPA